MAADSTDIGRVPVILLKTKSSPTDSYEEALASFRLPESTSHGRLDPCFVPVLHHRFPEEATNKLRSFLLSQHISHRPRSQYGGLIFTSQRAVEAFSQVVQAGQGSDVKWPYLQQIPIYSVGPATSRALRAVHQEPPLQIFGEHTGNGDALAEYILEHYRDWYSERELLPPLLFLVGEQRRDIIPRTLMSPDLGSDRRIQVDEIVVYETGVMESFPNDFQNILEETSLARERWVVVFSPTGCDTMLQGLNLFDPDSGSINLQGRVERTFIATIGPTTRAHLVNKFNFEPDVCAEAPSPEGVLKGIIEFSLKSSFEMHV